MSYLTKQLKSEEGRKALRIANNFLRKNNNLPLIKTLDTVTNSIIFGGPSSMSKIIYYPKTETITFYIKGNEKTSFIRDIK